MGGGSLFRSGEVEFPQPRRPPAHPPLLTVLPCLACLSLDRDFEIPNDRYGVELTALVCSIPKPSKVKLR